jgi:hypothetical protein
MSIRWLTIFLDLPAEGFAAGVRFWTALTGSGLSSCRGPEGEFATILPPAGDAYLRVQRVRDGGGGCHLDLHVDSPDESAAVAVGLGARTRVREKGLVVLDSPGGFTFCLVRWDGEGAVPGPFRLGGAWISRRLSSSPSVRSGRP